MPSPLPTAPPTLILVDDDADKRFWLERLLHKQFPENPVVSFGNCSAALLLIGAPLRKVVITNGRIETHDGIAFASYLRDQNNIPVVILSYRRHLEKRAREAGVVAFVDPADESGIRAAIANALQTAN